MTYREAADKFEKYIADNSTGGSMDIEVFQMAADLLREKADLEDCRNAIGKGNPIWYVDFEGGEIEEGEVSSVQYKNGVIDSVTIDFKESCDCDEFAANYIGDYLFASKRTAEKALRQGHPSPLERDFAGIDDR